MKTEKKIYSSYDEIDRDLEILNLERKLHYYKVKRSFEDLGEHITLPNLAEGFLEITKGDSSPLINRVFKIATPFLIKKALNLFFK